MIGPWIPQPTGFFVTSNGERGATFGQHMMRPIGPLSTMYASPASGGLFYASARSLKGDRIARADLPSLNAAMAWADDEARAMGVPL